MYHERDSNLDLNMITTEFSLSTNYFSTFFREMMGENFKDYITRRRVDEIKRLLVTTDLILKDIAPMSGHANLLTLQRNFKKITGKTPIEYKDRFVIKNSVF